MGHQRLLSKIATNDKHGENSPYFDGWKAYDRNPFHPTKNPQGVIQMGLAENQLCFDLIEEWIRNNSKASICTREGVHLFRDIANFQDYHGLPQFRKGVANFMSKARGGRVKYDPERILMSGGATGANELIMFCLADPADAFMVPTPYYPANSGLFCWMNLRRLLKEKTFEGEMKLWRVIINEVKLNVSPGSSFNCSEPGWFRVCFANMDDETVEVALKRIRAFVGRETNNGKRVELKRWKSINTNKLRLSFNSRRFDENVMSPHSPMPHSPLVRAT